MHFDDLLKEIGEFGLYQKRLYALLCIPSIIISALLAAQVFILGVPEHRCKLPAYNGTDTWDVQNDYHKMMVAQYIPDNSEHDYDRCHIYVYPDNMTSSGINATLAECQEWVYDESVYINTFAKQMNFVCGESLKISHAQSVFFGGMLVGSLLFGQLSDFIGRKKTLYTCLMVLLCSSVGLAWSPDYIVFVILMFIIGASTLGAYMTSYVIGMELVGPGKRKWTGNINPMFLTTGQLYLLLMVFLLRDWKYFVLALALPCALFLPYWCIVPESSRWLLSNGQHDKATQILKKAAKVNKVTVPDKVFTDIQDHQTHKTGRVWELFSNKTLAIRTSIIFFNWFVVSMAYYGVLLNIANLGVNLYLNFLLMTVAEYPSKISTIFLIDRIGRKKLYIGFMVIGGLACAATAFPILYKDGDNDLHPLLIALSLIGKMCIVGGFQTIYVLSAETFPTVVRNSGMGASSAFARVGSMLAPYIAKSVDVVGGSAGKAIPQTLAGGLALIAGLLCVFLPETLNTQMPDTIEEASKVPWKRSKVTDGVALELAIKEPLPKDNPGFESDKL